MSDDVVTLILIFASIAFGLTIGFTVGLRIGLGKGADRLADEWIDAGSSAPDAVDEWPAPRSRDVRPS